MRALIVCLDRSRGGLAATRALSAAGWDVGVGTPSGTGMVSASRHCSRSHVVPRPRSGDDFVHAVRQAVADGGYDVVFGGGDDWMYALADQRDRIGTVIAHPPIDVVDRAIDKLELGEAADSVGFDTPATVLATPERLDGWDGPVIVKCRSHWASDRHHEQRIEAVRCEHAAAARPHVERIRSAGFEAVLQQPVEGELHALIGVFDGRRLCGRVQQRSPRLWPTPTGVSCRAVTVDVEADLLAAGERLLAELRWQGLVELQFIAHEEGRTIIDLNGRFYGSLSLAVDAGVNLADLAARQALGERLGTDAEAVAGVRYQWLAGDIRRALEERRGGLVRDMASTLRWGLTASDSVLSVRDVGPAFDLLAGRLGRSGAEVTS